MAFSGGGGIPCRRGFAGHFAFRRALITRASTRSFFGCPDFFIQPGAKLASAVQHPRRGPHQQRRIDVKDVVAGNRAQARI